MNYLTNYYKHRCEQLQEQVDILNQKIQTINEIQRRINLDEGFFDDMAVVKLYNLLSGKSAEDKENYWNSRLKDAEATDAWTDSIRRENPTSQMMPDGSAPYVPPTAVERETKFRSENESLPSFMNPYDLEKMRQRRLEDEQLQREHPIHALLKSLLFSDISGALGMHRLPRGAYRTP